MNTDSRLNHMQHYLAAAAETADELLSEGGMTTYDMGRIISALAFIATATETIAMASIYSPVVSAKQGTQ